MLISQLQEDIIVLLTFDDTHAPIIRGIIDVNLFGGPYRFIAAEIYKHIDTYKKPPGLHLPNLFVGDKNEQAFIEIFQRMEAARADVQPPFVMAQLEKFVKNKSLRAIAIDLTKALQKDTDDGLEEAERLLDNRRRSTVSVFDPGTRLSDKARALAFLELSNTALRTGIYELDKRGFGPTRGELLLAIGNAKAGKSWFLIHLAKMALLDRVKVVHITLEMSEARVAQRYWQTYYSISKRREEQVIRKFTRDKQNSLTGLPSKIITPKYTFEDENIKGFLTREIGRWKYRRYDNIFIKQFPTGQLTVRELEAFLDNLKLIENFEPYVVIVDYPDLMKLDTSNLRASLDELYKDLRGLAVTRNIAMVIVSQSNRVASSKKKGTDVGLENVAEAYSKVQHADLILTYNQTPQERQLGLARLEVSGGRNDSDKFAVIITQQYGIGQFVLDSQLMTSNYKDLLPQEEP